MGQVLDQLALAERELARQEDEARRLAEEEFCRNCAEAKLPGRCAVSDRLDGCTAIFYIGYCQENELFFDADDHPIDNDCECFAF